jgi:GGDEF domain-containing protein
MALALFAGAGGIPGLASGGLPKVFLLGGFVLAVFYHRSRVAVLALAMATLVHVSSTHAGGFTAFYFGGGVYAVVAGLLAFTRDRGILTRVGMAQLGCAALSACFAALLVTLAPQDIARFLSVLVVPASATVWSGLPQPVLLAFLLAVPSTLVLALHRGGPVDRGIFWHLLAVALALHFGADAQATVVLFLAAALTLGLSVMETSYAMAFRDDLTGLPARRALMRDLEGIGRSYAAAMVDVDHFKRFNDRYGHDVGDQVLRMVGAKLAKTPGGGRAYRYGGEEFAVLFPGKTREEVMPHLARLCRSVEDASFTLRSWRRPRKRPVDPSAWRGAGNRTPRRLSVTVSIGVADVAGGDPSPDAVLKRADQALYRAKEGGRNRVSK